MNHPQMTQIPQIEGDLAGLDLAGRVAKLEALTARLAAKLSRLRYEGEVDEFTPAMPTTACPLRDRVVTMVGEEFLVDPRAILGRRREQPVALARQVAMSLVVEFGQLSLAQCGTLFGRDHGTVLHAERAVRAACETEPETRARLARLWKRLKEAT